MNIKSCGRLFQILWPSQKTWTLCILYMYVQVIFTYYIISIHCVLGRKRWPKVPLTANLGLTQSLCTQKRVGVYCSLISGKLTLYTPWQKGSFVTVSFHPANFLSVAATVNTELTTTEGQELSLILLVIQSLVQGVTLQKRTASAVCMFIQGVSYWNGPN